ncbi:Ltp family lipoprotein [Candidatus Pacearchaeota archaeon]|nr:Ltp family lipoprotein [Candidatus Pacearchaeota archaeon]
MIIGPFLPGDKQESNEGSLTLLETGNQDNDCNPNWQCSSWSICSSSSKQTRTCSDNNNCGVLTNKPAVSQSCTPSVEEKSDKATIGEKNALSKALSYLSIMPFSYSGLIEQLEYEGYTHQEAVYGVDNSGADWNEQAALKAQSYLDIMPFSREGLIEQLEYEGYTREQAEYGVQAVGY